MRLRGILATCSLEWQETPPAGAWTDMPANQYIQLNAGVGHTGFINGVSVILNTQNIPVHLQGLNSMNRFVTAQFRTTNKKQHIFNEGVNFTYAPDKASEYLALTPTGGFSATGVQGKNINRYSTAGAAGVTSAIILPFFPFSLDPEAVKSFSNGQTMNMDKYFPPNTQMRITLDLANTDSLIDQVAQRLRAASAATKKTCRATLRHCELIADIITTPMDSKFLAAFNAHHLKHGLYYPITVPREHSLAIVSGLETTVNILPLIPTTPELIRVFFISDMLEMLNFPFPTTLRKLKIQCGEHILFEVSEIGTSNRHHSKQVAYEDLEKRMRNKSTAEEFFNTVRYDQIVPIETGRLKQFYQGVPPALEVHCEWDKTDKSPDNTYIIIHTITTGNLLLSKSSLFHVHEN